MLRGGGGGGGGVGVESFVWIMNYLRHILMGHEIFFKNFSGSQNIFLFFKLRGLEHKYPN